MIEEKQALFNLVAIKRIHDWIGGNSADHNFQIDCLPPPEPPPEGFGLKVITLICTYLAAIRPPVSEGHNWNFGGSNPVKFWLNSTSWRSNVNYSVLLN